MNKITLEDSVQEVIFKLSEGNPGAVTAIVQLCESCSYEEFLTYLIFFDDYEIYGSKIYMLWNDCCDRDLNKLIETISYIRANLNREEVHKNLDRGRALPFI